jgi:hypothetical protein
MKKVIFFLALVLFSFVSRAQIITEQTSPQTISSQIPGYPEVTNINSLIIPYTPPALPAEPKYYR